MYHAMGSINEGSVDEPPLFHTLQGAGGLEDAYPDAASMFVVRDELRRNKFLAFSTAQELERWHNERPRSAHEIVYPTIQRLWFDIDGPEHIVDQLYANYLANVPPAAPPPSDANDVDLLEDLLIVRPVDPVEARSGWLVSNIMRTIEDTLWAEYPSDFEHDSNIVVADSSGLCESGWKYSYHLIVYTAAVQSARESKRFNRLVTAALPHGIGATVDKNATKRLQSVRLLGSFRMGTQRRLKRSPLGAQNRPWTDYLVHPPPGNIRVLPAKCDAADEQHLANIALPEGELAEIIKLLADDAHQVRCVSGPCVLFNRLRPSMCRLCNEVHHHDNTVMVSVSAAGVAYELCRHAPRKSAAIGYVRPPQPDPTGTALAQPAADNSSITKHIAEIESARHNPHEYCMLEKGGLIYSEDQMRPYELVPTLCVKAQMKLGKTKQLRAYVDTHFPLSRLAPPVIRFVTFRQTFSSAMTEKFPEFTMYSAVKSGDLTVVEHPWLIVQVESLHRLRIAGDDPIDLLILDECESVFQQFNSPLHRNYSAAFAAFEWMLRTARHVIAMDANLGNCTAMILANLRPTKPAKLHWNAFKRAAGQQFEFTTHTGQWFMELESALQAGQKIVVTSSSLKDAQCVDTYIRTTHPALNVGIYTSETPAGQKSEHFASVHQHWSTLDVLIYTPTCTAGVSFELEHFDTLFGVFMDVSCDVETCRQMMGRVRNLSTGRHVVCLRLCGARPAHLPCTIDDIRRQVYNYRGALYRDVAHILHMSYDDDGTPRLYETPGFQMWLQTQRVINLSKADFIRRFVDQVWDTGATVRSLDNGATAADKKTALCRYKDISEAVQLRRAEQVSVADELQPEEAEQLRNNIRDGEDVSLTLRRALERYTLVDVYKLHAANISAHTVQLYNNKPTKEAYRAWCSLTAASDVKTSLSALQTAAKDRYEMREPQTLQSLHTPKDYTYNIYWKLSTVVRIIAYAGFDFNIWKVRSESYVASELRRNYKYIRDSYRDISVAFGISSHAKWPPDPDVRDSALIAATIPLVNAVAKHIGTHIRVKSGENRTCEYGPGPIAQLFEFLPHGTERRVVDKPIVWCKLFVGSGDDEDLYYDQIT